MIPVATARPIGMPPSRSSDPCFRLCALEEVIDAAECSTWTVAVTRIKTAGSAKRDTPPVGCVVKTHQPPVALDAGSRTRSARTGCRKKAADRSGRDRAWGRTGRPGSTRSRATLIPTAHAEVTAIRDAVCQLLQRFDLRGCELAPAAAPARCAWRRSMGTPRSSLLRLRSHRRGARWLRRSVHLRSDRARSVGRSLVVKVGCDAADELFRNWIAKPDKIPY